MVKVFDISDPSIEAAANTEVDILSKLKHPAINRMKDFFVSGLQQKAYLVLEKVSGQTLQQVIKDKKRLEITLAKKLFVQLLQAVSYLH